MVDTREIHQAPLLERITELESQLAEQTRFRQEDIAEFKRQLSQLATAQEQLAERDALIGTVRQLAGCELRNVSDVDMPTHSREIGDQIEAAQARVRVLEELKLGPRWHWIAPSQYQHDETGRIVNWSGNPDAARSGGEEER